MLALQTKQPCGGHFPPLHGQHHHTGSQARRELPLEGLQGVGGEAVGAAEQHQIRRIQLVVEQRLQIAEVIKAGVGLALGLQCRRITHHTALTQGFTIHHGHHARDTGAGANVGPLKSLHQGHRQGQATGLHDDAVQLVGPLQQLLHGGQELILNSATEAAVGQLHHGGVGHALGGVVGAHATTADQLTVDAHLTKFVHQHGQPQAAVEQQVTQQGGFAGAKEAGHHRDRQPGG